MQTEGAQKRASCSTEERKRDLKEKIPGIKRRRWKRVSDKDRVPGQTGEETQRIQVRKFRGKCFKKKKKKIFKRYKFCALHKPPAVSLETFSKK